jgi:hypothetical protein
MHSLDTSEQRIIVNHSGQTVAGGSPAIKLVVGEGENRRLTLRGNDLQILPKVKSVQKCPKCSICQDIAKESFIAIDSLNHFHCYDYVTGSWGACRSKIVHSRTPSRNRLAKVLPKEWQLLLVSLGSPKRKYTAICRATLTDGRVIEELIIEEGWIIATERQGLTGVFERRIDFDPRTITGLELIQVI